MYDNLFFLSQHRDLRIRQAVADQRSSPQDDNGSLTAAIVASIDAGTWADGFNDLPGSR